MGNPSCIRIRAGANLEAQGGGSVGRYCFRLEGGDTCDRHAPKSKVAALKTVRGDSCAHLTDVPSFLGPAWDPVAAPIVLTAFTSRGNVARDEGKYPVGMGQTFRWNVPGVTRMSC